MKTLLRRFNRLPDFTKFLLAALLGGLVTATVVSYATGPTDDGLSISQLQQQANRAAVLTSNLPSEMPDFRVASAMALPTVVHISSVREAQASSGNSEMEQFFRDFGMPHGFEFGPRGPQAASGSGVILTETGYIVTNNHVVEDADKVEVTLYDNRKFEAEIIGTDPSTDLALLKINAANLPFLPFGNSDDAEVGEWVLAVGNPFNLTSTVTAGIVSAKGRSIGILNDRYRIESFIQTDAAVNPGNSGGALIDTDGKLVGINTAIASRTGGYQGYSFAVPVNIVRKVVDDLKLYGKVQRALLGISIRDVDADLADEKDLDVNKGVWVEAVGTGSAADDAGLQKGDVILKIDDAPVETAAALQEQISLKRPGEKVLVTFLRGGQKRTVNVTLKSKSGTMEITEAPRSDEMRSLGASLSPAPQDELAALKLEYGVKVEALLPGKLRDAGVRKGFIITRVDKRAVKTPKDVEDAIQKVDGGVLIEGYYPNGEKAYYALGM